MYTVYLFLWRRHTQSLITIVAATINVPTTFVAQRKTDGTYGPLTGQDSLRLTTLRRGVTRFRLGGTSCFVVRFVVMTTLFGGFVFPPG